MGNMADALGDLPLRAVETGQGSALAHYRIAEAWLYKAEPGHGSSRSSIAGETPEICAAIAQVHATLALAGIEALKALVPAAAAITTADHRGWRAAASEGESHG